jgi:hypothetical protein
MASRRAQLRALGYLGDSGVVPPPNNAAPNAWTQITGIPGTQTLEDLLTNAWTGNLTQDQVDALNQQNAASLVQAGMPAEQAAAQAATDTNAVLSTFAAPGGLDLTWTGALPSQPGFATAAASAVAAPVASGFAWLSQYWPWLALGGIGLWWASRELGK